MCQKPFVLERRRNLLTRGRLIRLRSLQRSPRREHWEGQLFLRGSNLPSRPLVFDSSNGFYIVGRDYTYMLCIEF